VGVFKLTHDKFQRYNKSTARSKVMPPSMAEFYKSFDEARKNSPGKELDKHIKNAVEDLNPLRVLNLFKMITPTDCELLGINPAEGRPEMFIWQYVPVPPVCIRPSVAQDNASTEDDLTTKLADIVHMSSLIKATLQKGQSLGTTMEQWDFMQLQIAMYVNSGVPGLQQSGFGKAIRGVCQRLKGKQGRFRGNLSGKRVDFSGRTVISPDPNLSVEQVALPELVAKNMTYPERVFQHNIKKLRERVRNGPSKWPGANQIHKLGEENKRSLKFGDRKEIAKNLQIGDVVVRHLEDGDIVLFNRQPSLHKLSIMAHYAKILPWRTFRFNECVCGPYNADFDGDEMNIHVPQTEEARAEAINLMGVKNNLCTPKNGELIISATQDFITASYLLSSKDKFFDRKTFTQLCMYMVDSNMHIDIPPPAIIKPEAMWTGKQLFSVLMRPNKQSNVLVNLDAKCRDYKKPPAGQAPDMDINDGWLVIRNSQVMCGRMDKTTVGSGKKESIFYIILRDFGPDQAVKAMDRLAKLSARFLTNQGFSIGINDVIGGNSLNDQKTALVTKAYGEIDDLIKLYKDGKLEKTTGCNLEETLENAISGLLSRLRQQAGEFCINTLSPWNSPLIMAKSGSKGSDINVAQMITLVGQQMIASARIADGFQDRTLPHFPKNARQPLSKGFVRSSFFSGLTPTEFFFHAISGREGLVDTAVKTAETGYMSRRLMKSLEDLSTQYDDTVRTASSGVVQFQFGADKLDPVDMEGNAVPVHFDRTFTYAESTTWNNNERSLFPYEITEVCKKLLQPEKDKLCRRGLLKGEPLKYDDDTLYGVDEHESARGFLDTVSNYVSNLALRQSKARKAAGLSELRVDPQVSKEKYNVSKEEPARLAHIGRVAKVSETTLREFVKLCLSKYKKAQVVPGHAVGAVGAQSIGEPGTQMTLRTFHFAGVAGMSITEGVPRIKEIINASKAISTPVITCPLENPNDIVVSRVVKGRIEKTYISDVIRFMEEMWSASRATICLLVDTQSLSKMHLDLTAEDIANAICKDRKLKVRPADVQCVGNCIFVSVTHDTTSTGSVRGVAAKAKLSLDSGGSDLLLRLNYLKRQIPQISVLGYQDVTRALIETSEKTGNTVLVEGYGLRACMTTEGVIGTKTTSNSVMEVLSVLGIEAARATIATEIAKVMRGMNIDPRHMQLLADVMTYKGEVLGITRFGLSKMRDSVLQLASFEKTPDHLFEAAAGMKRDRIEGVSECIIMGQTMSAGTGAFGVVRKLGLRDGVDVKKLPTQFEDLWAWETKERKRGKWLSEAQTGWRK
jgi:DNA-directed RNA polymerase III subunit RPC1